MFVLLHLKCCLIMLLLLGCKIRGCGRAVRTEFGLGFLDLLLGIRELQFGLLAFDHGNNLLFAGVQARFLGGELGVHHISEILFFLQTRCRA